VLSLCPLANRLAGWRPSRYSIIQTVHIVAHTSCTCWCSPQYEARKTPIYTVAYWRKAQQCLQYKNTNIVVSSVSGGFAALVLWIVYSVPTDICSARITGGCGGGVSPHYLTSSLALKQLYYCDPPIQRGIDIEKYPFSMHTPSTFLQIRPLDI